MGRKPSSRRAPRGQSTFADFLDRMARRAEAQDPRGQATGLFFVVLALLGLGLLVHFAYDATVLRPPEFKAAVRSQLIFRGLALGALLLGYRLGPQGIRPALPFLTLVSGVLLLLCFAPGIGVMKNGSHRWVDLGIVFQPSEVARMVVVLWIADRCVRLGPRVYDLRRGILPMLGLGFAFFFLILIETDLGGAMLLFICVLSTMWVGGARPLPMALSLFTVGGGALTLATLTIPYIRDRVAVFLGSMQNEQVSETLAALASGGALGQGFTHGGARLAAVPYLQSDYVFAQIGEELGLFGLFLVLGLFVVRSLEKFMEFFGDGEIAVLFR